MNRYAMICMKVVLTFGTTGLLLIGLAGSAMARQTRPAASGQRTALTRICPVTGATVRCPGLGLRWTGRARAGGQGYGRLRRPGYGRRGAGGYGLRLRNGTGPNCPWR